MSDGSPARGPAAGESRAVASDQAAPHPRLGSVLARHRARPSERPWPAHAAAALAPLAERLGSEPRPLVLDSGCGTAESTAWLATRHPDALVVGIDQSAHRLARAAAMPANAMTLRARAEDVWRLARERGWPVAAHYLLYPNPWPKQRHLMRRWHAHPAMADLVAFGGALELRTNWRIYAEEFAHALTWWCAVPAGVGRWAPRCAVSAFERKYLASGQRLYRVTATLPAPRRRHDEPGGRAQGSSARPWAISVCSISVLLKPIRTSSRMWIAGTTLSGRRAKRARPSALVSTSYSQ